MSIEVGKRYQFRFCGGDVTGPILELLDNGGVIVASEQHNDAPMLALEHEIVRELRELPEMTEAPAWEVQL
jgi:hypothetical protein